MPNIFRLDDNYVDKPKRNVFDLSFQNNLTLKMGKLIPVMCKEVLPGDSFKIDTRFGLKYLPQVFPVQTRQRASVKYYYVRNRPLWKDWMDFIGKTKSGLTLPYLNFKEEDAKLLRPSSIADYMGIPVRLRDSAVAPLRSLIVGKPNFVSGSRYAYLPSTNQTFSEQGGDPFTIRTFKSVDTVLNVPSDATKANYNYPMEYLYGGMPNSVVPVPLVASNAKIATAVGSTTSYNNHNASDPSLSPLSLHLFRVPLVPATWEQVKAVSPSGYGGYAILRGVDGRDYLYKLTGGTQTISKSITYYETSSDTATTLTSYKVQLASVVGFLMYSPLPSGVARPYFDFPVQLNLNPDLCWCDIALDEWPFANETSDGVRINALPFRALQSVYNALVRNAENNPFILNGVPEYNKYISSDEGGATSPFDLLADYFANWADDRFTTALPTPQQGNAPLVGLTGVQGATLTTSTNDGTTSTLHLQVDSDTGNVVMVDGVSSDSPEYLNDAMMSAVEYGITINDLRNVNAFQRWLENNIRRGYKYKDQLMSHYGVSARFDVLDMPEFIGGVSRDVDCHQVTQTVTNEYGDLGEYAGQSYVTGDAHSIEKYCDEHGFIIGILSVYPMPLYQDALPKHLIKSDPFDFYFPEFGKIGPQPITKKEIAFCQSFMEGNMDETFGYQRPWYDYIESLDEVHGLYQTDFRNFLIARDFGQVPTLGSNFLTIDSDDVNNTFYSDDDKDKILGQLAFNVSVKRCIPLIGIPSIE